MVHARARFIDRGGNWSVELERALSLPRHQSPGALYLARFSRDVGYRRPCPQAFRGPTDLQGCPMFAPAYVGRKRWRSPPQPLVPDATIDSLEPKRRDLRFLPLSGSVTPAAGLRGHPATGGGDRAQKRVHSKGWESLRMFSVGAFNVEACARREHPSLLPR